MDPNPANTRPLVSRKRIERILDTMTRTPAQILGECPLPRLPPRRFRPSPISYEAALAITQSYGSPSTLLGEEPLPKHLPPRKPRRQALVQDDEEADTTPPNNSKKRGRLQSDGERLATPPKKRKRSTSVPSTCIALAKSAAPCDERRLPQVGNAREHVAKNSGRQNCTRLKRGLERGGDHEEARQQKVRRKEHRQKPDTAQKCSGEREDTIPDKQNRRPPPLGPFAFRSVPADKILAVRQRRKGAGSDGSPSGVEKQKLRERAARKPMLRPVPASVVLGEAASAAKKAPQNNRDSKKGYQCDGSSSNTERQRGGGNTPRKPMLRSVPVDVILGSGAGKSAPVGKMVTGSNSQVKTPHQRDGAAFGVGIGMRNNARNPMLRSIPVDAAVGPDKHKSKLPTVVGGTHRGMKGSASPALVSAADPLPQPVHQPATQEELGSLAKKLEQLAAEQRELLGHFDTLDKLCNSFYSKKAHNDFEEVARKAFGVLFKFCLKKETEMRVRKRTNGGWQEARNQALANYKYLARQFGSQRILELEKIGRTRTARFLSHQVRKIYVRIFILQRCWNREQRMGENEMKSLMNSLHREGSSADMNKALSQRETGYIANLLDDHANIVGLLDSLMSDWNDGDDQAGFEITMPF
eukprot:gb/GEZJ01001159.1/.p1 GENE.gb/GEZJ01001159.1/~~gb/GEZJ01001159.1/.p1  ORF type:complete len:640 (-),score=80.60 gb/GEZJ01001159.1/:1390-3309(-)